MTERSSFILHLDTLSIAVQNLSDEELGQLLRAMYMYHKGEEYSPPNDSVKLMFHFFKNGFERDNEKYEKVSQARAKAVNKRWSKGQQEAGTNTPSPPPKAEPLQEIILEPDLPNPPKPKAIKKENTEGVRDLWNDICGETFGYVKTISLVRSQKIKARIKDFGDDYMARFEEIFNRLVNAPFCIEGAKKWCNFDWILANDNNYVKLLEGRYDHHSTDNGNRPLTKFELAQLSKQQAANAIANSCVADFEREREKESRVPIMQL